MMAFIGALLFALIFMLLKSSIRNPIIASLTNAGHWMVAWAPYSFIILALVLFIAPVASFLIMKRWPETPEPEDPLARYKNADDVIYD
jgi:phosphotransferase system  glucose/maltose/N-acetylglucosamine-specific IIC component